MLSKNRAVWGQNFKSQNLSYYLKWMWTIWKYQQLSFPMLWEWRNILTVLNAVRSSPCSWSILALVSNRDPLRPNTFVSHIMSECILEGDPGHAVLTLNWNKQTNEECRAVKESLLCDTFSKHFYLANQYFL